MIARSRTLWVGGLMVLLIGGLLVAWFTTGWSDVRARQATEHARPGAAATLRSAELARELRDELTGVLTRELSRPYFHYQNLFRDPRASASIAVAPSPLAAGSPEPLVRGYFQIDPAGKVTTPTLNDEVPALSESTRLAEHTKFRADVSAQLAIALRPPPSPPKPDPVRVASVEPTPVRPRPRPTPAPAPTTPTVATVDPAPPPQQVSIDPNDTRNVYQVISRNSYEQNRVSNSIYIENDPTTSQQPVQKPAAPPPSPPPTPRPRPRPAPPSTVTETIAAQPEDAVTVIVAPFAYRTETFAGAPALVATRAIETPDETLTQGFVIDRIALDAWLEERGGDATLAPRATGDAAAASVIGDWTLVAHPNAAALSASAHGANQIATMFLLKFGALGTLAMLAGIFVVVLVSRAERMARERSQFAAAAAHELRTPLAGLQLYGDMLADGLGDPDKQRDYARRMAEEAARLGRVVSNVLGFSQLERGNLSVNPQEGDLATELAALASRAEPALDRAGAVLSLEVEPELCAVFDRDALARIIGNLLDNAEKYARTADDRTITLKAAAIEGTRPKRTQQQMMSQSPMLAPQRAALAEPGAIEILVSDHGPGVPDAARGTLFTAFSRGVAADGPAGLGLGLALSQSLARAMGGELAYRATDEGAVFVLRLRAR